MNHLLRCGLAFIWLFTGLGVLHPFYREVGQDYLSRLGLPGWLMVPACILEVVLGLRVLLGPPRPWLTTAQLLLLAGFTIILAWVEPALLVNPYGMLSKNVTLAAMIVCDRLIQREGWTRRARRTLLAGLAFIWIWEGVFACVLFQSPALRDVLSVLPLPREHLERVLIVAGVAQSLAGAALLVLRGSPLRLLLLGQLLGLIVICILVTIHEPGLWFHPFGPVSKNIPLILATLAASIAAVPPAISRANSNPL